MKVLHTFNGHLDVINQCQYINNQSVVTGSSDRQIKIWDLNKAECSLTLISSSECLSVSTTNSENFVVSGHSDGHIRLWSVNQHKMVQDIQKLHSDKVTSVCISPVESYFVTNSRDNTVKLVDMRTYKEVFSFRHDNYTNGSDSNKGSLSQNGQFYMVCSKNGHLIFFDLFK